MTIKRLGSRYGKRVRDRLAAIENISKKDLICPYCRKQKVKRLSIGIFECKKCKAKFTGKAYSLKKLRPVESTIKKDIPVPKEEEEIIDEQEDIEASEEKEEAEEKDKPEKAIEEELEEEPELPEKKEESEETIEKVEEDTESSEENEETDDEEKENKTKKKEKKKKSKNKQKDEDLE